MEDLYIIKDRLNEALKIRDMNPIDLARLSGISKASVSRYLSGKVIPRSNAIEKMARALHVNPAWVLGYNTPMQFNDNTAASPIDTSKLTQANYQRLLAYYQALVDSQGGDK